MHVTGCHGVQGFKSLRTRRCVSLHSLELVLAMTSFGGREISALEDAFTATLPPAVGRAVSAYLNRACEGLDGIDSQLASSSRILHALHAQRADNGPQASPQQIQSVITRTPSQMGSHFRLLRSSRRTANTDRDELAYAQGSASEARQRHSIMMGELQEARRDLAAIAQCLIPESDVSPPESDSAHIFGTDPSACALSLGQLLAPCPTIKHLMAQATPGANN